MPRVATFASWAALVVAIGTPPAVAQPREALGGVVVDLRAVTVTLPTGLGWAPTVTTPGMLVPSRGLGVDGGVHVFIGPGRHRRLSLGATGLAAEGRATGVDAPATATRLLVMAPHAAINFGHRDGWSYLSVGAGTASVRTTVGGMADAATDWGIAFHYGGGARWFLREHLAVSLDLRFWALRPRQATATRPSAAATTRIAFGAGVSFR